MRARNALAALGLAAGAAAAAALWLRPGETGGPRRSFSRPGADPLA